MALPEKLDLDGGRAIVIEDVPPGTGIVDLIRAFSAYGPIRFGSVGPPAVVSFETEAAAAHALLVATMKSVSLLGDLREKRKPQVPSPAQAHPAASSGNHPSPSIALAPPLGASPETEISPNDASPAEAEVAASETKMSPTAEELVDKILDRNMLMQDRLSRRESLLQDLRRQLVGGQIQNGSTPAPAQPATNCCNRPSSSGGASMASANENTEIGSSTGGSKSNPAPHEERRLPVPWSVSVVYSLAALTEDECFYRFVRAYLCGVLFFACFIMPIFNVPEVFP